MVWCALSNVVKRDQKEKAIFCCVLKMRKQYFEGLRREIGLLK